MYQLLKSLLFLMPAEKAHHFTTNALKIAFKVPLIKVIFQLAFQVNDTRLQRNLFGLTFKNPVGLAAGFDKNAEFMEEFAAMGFGFLEIGTVTPLPQAGNPQPRLFRVKKDRALINRMGFNNKGMNAVKDRLRKRPKGILIGGNIGKNKATGNEHATSDYLKCFETLFPFVDYFVINVSSPNTPDLRKLQDREPLEALIRELQKANRKKPHMKPLLLKIAPDLTNSQLDDIVEIAQDTGLSGIIATNTTISRQGLQEAEEIVSSLGPGGLSGAPLLHRSTDVITYLKGKYPALPIIAAGGIMGEEDALEKLRAGADLVQIYTGLVYEGPGLIKKINKAILKEGLTKG